MQTLAVDIAKLKNGNYKHKFEVSDAFFQPDASDLVLGAKVIVDLDFDKSEAMIVAHFVISGWVLLECGRSLEHYQQAVDTTGKVYYKYGDEEGILAEDIEVIGWGAPKLDVTQAVYDFIMLAIPIRRVKPEYLEAEAVDTASAEINKDQLLYVSTDPNMLPELDVDSDQPITEAVDPRFNILLKLRNQDN